MTWTRMVCQSMLVLPSVAGRRDGTPGSSFLPLPEWVDRAGVSTHRTSRWVPSWWDWWNSRMASQIHRHKIFLPVPSQKASFPFSYDLRSISRTQTKGYFVCIYLFLTVPYLFHFPYKVQPSISLNNNRSRWRLLSFYSWPCLSLAVSRFPHL